MSADLGISKRSHDHVVIISKFAWSINSLLNVHVLTWKFLNFPFYSILHKMLFLSLIVVLHSTWWTFRLSLRIDHLILIIHHGWIIFSILKSIVIRSDSPGNRRWWLHAYTTTSRIILIVELVDIIFILHVSIRSIILNSLSSSAICKIIMHNLPSFSLCLNTACLRPVASAVVIIIFSELRVALILTIWFWSFFVETRIDLL